MRNFTFKALVILIGCYAGLNAQKNVFGRPVHSINPANGLIRCVSAEYEQSLREEYPSRGTKSEFEQWLAPKVEAEKQRLLTSRTDVVVTIPVVVHVIHNGDAVGANENISNAQVMSQITVLNQDYRRVVGTRGYNNNPVGADIQIEFCLAQRKPNGTATNGIDRVNLGQANWSTESQVENTLKPQTIWDPTQYFNIWVCAFTDNLSAELGGVLGYAQFPDNSGLGGLPSTDPGGATRDGVIIDYRCFGSSDIATGPYFTDYDKGRTATHEIGHFFGLRHIWGDSDLCDIDAADSFKDYCPDTPAAAEEHYDCASTYNTCPSAPGNDMTQNYMDYSNDTCMNIFTINQKARVMAVLANSPRRSTLTTSTTCQLLGTESFDKFEGINLFPNPADSYVTVNVSDISDLPESISVFNAIGQMISERQIKSVSDMTINTAALSKGVYFVKVKKDSAEKTLRFIRN